MEKNLNITIEKDEQSMFTLSQIEKSKEIKQVQKGLTVYTEQVNTLTVADQKEYDSAGVFCKDIKTARKKIEEKRKFFVDPYNQTVKRINEIFKDKTKSLDEIEKLVKGKMIAWYQIEQKRIEAERAEIDEQNRKKLEKQAAKIEAEPEKIIAPVALKAGPAVIEQTSKTENATMTVKKNWKWDLIDMAQVPAEYLILDEKKLNRIVKAGIREIKGIRIYSEDGLSIR